MARTLPWLLDKKPSSGGLGPKTTTTKRVVPGKSANRPAKRVKLDDDAGASGRDSPASDVKSATSARPSPRVASPVRRQNGDIFSSSPPPIEEPVEEEYMREGLKDDDVFMMVEDELYDVARTFTAHIHQQEYERLRREARERNKGRAVNIARPVDGRTVLPEDIKRAKERKAMEAKRREGLDLQGANFDADAGGKKQRKDQSWHGTLGTLMGGASQDQEKVVGLKGPVIDSRAAAGFKEGQSTPSKKRTSLRPDSKAEPSGSASEDDLNVSPSVFSRKAFPKTEPPERPMKPIVKQSPSPPPQPERDKLYRSKMSTPIESLSETSKSVSTSVKGGNSEVTEGKGLPKPLVKPESDDGMHSFFKPRPLINSRRNRGAQTNTKTEDEKEQRKRRYDEIPLF